MALPRKTQKPETAENVPQIAVPHVPKTHEGGVHPLVEEALGSYGPQDKVKKLDATQENSGSTVLRSPNRTAETPSDLAQNGPHDPSKVDSHKVSLPEFKVRTALAPPDFASVRHRLSNVNDILSAIASPCAKTVLDHARAGTMEALCNKVYGAMVEAMQVRWGCQWVTKTTNLGTMIDGHWVAYPLTESRIVGQVQAGERQAEFDAEMFAVDVAFLDFMCDAHEACENAGLPTAYLEDRIETRLVVLEPGFRGLAAELAQHQAAFSKAEDIQEAGGWSPDKVAAAEKKLALMANRMAVLYYVLDCYRPDLLPAEIADKGPTTLPTNPVLAHFIAAGAFHGLYQKFGEAIATQLHDLALAWEKAGDHQQAIGDQYKRLLREAIAGQEVAA